MRNIVERIHLAMEEPARIAPALCRRLFPHSGIGTEWVRRGDGFVTFRSRGFVTAPNPAMLLARHHYEVAAIRRSLGKIRVSRSLEVGCGYGRLSPTFASFSDTHVGADINEEALGQAAIAYPEITFQMASATDLPFPDSSFGLITTWTVLQHIPPSVVGKAYGEILRVLKPGGLLLICDETRHPEGAALHTWHRDEAEYRAAFLSLSLQQSYEIEEINRIPGMDSPGRVMTFHDDA